MTGPISEDELDRGASKNIASWDAFIQKHNAVFAKVTDISTWEAAKRAGKLGIIYNFQNTTPFGWILERLSAFIRMGVRQIQLSHDYRNYVVDGCRELTNGGRAGSVTRWSSIE